MARMTLREAALRSARSITTLRRYIRSGRLRAEKRDGRFGQEYFVSEEQLLAAGLEPRPDEPVSGGARLPARQEFRTALAQHRVARESVPLSLYQELQMKHEQLLVQYGMMRAAGLRSMELHGELQAGQQRTREGELRQTKLRRQLRAAHLELEGRALEIAALHEKVRALEMLTRNAVTNETIEKQFSAVARQSERIDALSDSRSLPTRRRWRSTDSGTPDH